MATSFSFLTMQRENLVSSSSYKDIKPVMGEGSSIMASSKPNYLPKAPLANTVTFGIKTPMYMDFEGDISIQSITQIISFFYPLTLDTVAEGTIGSAL